VTSVVLLLISAGSWRGRIRGFGLGDWGIFCLNGFVGITVSISLFHMAIMSFRNAASSAVVFSANPVFVTILARYINGEPWSRGKWLSVVLGATGIAAFAWESGNPTSESLLGLSLMIGAAVSFALSICISRRHVGRYGPVAFMGFSSFFGSVFVLPLGLWRGGSAGFAAMAEGWLLVGYIVVFGTAVAYGAYYFGLSRTSAYEASMSFFMKPVLASALSVVLLRESLNVWTVSGTALIVGGLFLSIRLPGRKTGVGRVGQGERIQ